MEDCYAGLLFEDESEASHFLKRVHQKDKYASKATLNNKAAIAMKKSPNGPSAPGPRGDPLNSRRRIHLDMGPVYYDDEPPVEWRALYAELASQGITEEMIAENTEFIKNYIRQQGGPLVGLEPPIPRSAQKQFPNRRVRSETVTSTVSVASANSTNSDSISSVRRAKAPPPPPPPSAAVPSQSSASHPPPASSASSNNRRSLPPPAANAPPPPPPPPAVSQDDSHSSPSPPPLPEKDLSLVSEPASPTSATAHRVPPPMPFIGTHVPRPAATPPAPPVSTAPQAASQATAYGQQQQQQQQPLLPPRVPSGGVPPQVPGRTSDPYARPVPPPPQLPPRATGPLQPMTSTYTPQFGAPPTQGFTPPPPPQRGQPVAPISNGPPPPPPRVPQRVPVSGGPPPPPPQRGSVPPPPPPSRGQGTAPPPPARSPAIPTTAFSPQPQYTPLPPTQPQYGTSVQSAVTPVQAPYSPPPPPQTPYSPPPPPQTPYNPPPPPPTLVSQPPAPPPLPPTTSQSQSFGAPPSLPTAAPPIPPALPVVSAPPLPPGPPPAMGAPPPPPGPPPAMGAPPPPPGPPPAIGGPPPPPPMDLGAAAPQLPVVDGGRDALLASIRTAGGIGSLKKVDKSQLDRPSPLLMEAKGQAPPPSAGGAAPGGQPANLADALSAALSKRKNKVAQSDDEDSDGWD